MGNCTSPPLIQSILPPHVTDLRAVSADPMDTLRQVCLFRKLGFVIIRNALSPNLCDSLLRYSQVNFPVDARTRSTNCSPRWWDCDAYGDFLRHPCFKPLLDSLSGREEWHFCKAGADVAGAYVDDQEVHQDRCGQLGLKFSESGVYDPASSTPCLEIRASLHHIPLDMAPTQISCWDDVVAWATSASNHNEFPQCLRYRFAVPAGCCLVRDVRLLHGGTKNEHGQPRHTTGFVVTSGEMMRNPYRYRVQRPLTDPRYARLKLDEVYRDHRCFDYIRSYDSSYASYV